MLTFLLFGGCPIIPLHFCNTYILTLLEPDFTIYLYKVIPISFFVLGVANLGKLYIVPFPMYLKLLLFLFYVFSCLYFIIIFFSDIFFLLKLFAIENPILESIIYKQTKKKKNYQPLYPSLRLLKTNLFCLLPRRNPTPYLPLPSLSPYHPYPPPPDSRLNQIKCQKVLVFKTFSTCCHFLLYIACFFSLFNEIFSSMFLTFVISRIKDFIFNDSDFLEL